MGASELRLNAPAPDFTLKDSSGHPVRLGDLHGHPVVLIFYPADLTPGCTMQLCAIRDDWQKFHARGIRVFGINHGDTASHHSFVSKHHLPFPLLTDLHKKISVLYGAVRSLFGVKIIRRTVIGIDAAGLICYLKRGMPRTADILKAIK